MAKKKPTTGWEVLNEANKPIILKSKIVKTPSYSPPKKVEEVKKVIKKKPLPTSGWDALNKGAAEKQAEEARLAKEKAAADAEKKAQADATAKANAPISVLKSKAKTGLGVFAEGNKEEKRRNNIELKSEIVPTPKDKPLLKEPMKMVKKEDEEDKKKKKIIIRKKP